MAVEKEDLDVHVHYGFVCFGSINDFVAIRHLIQKQFPKTNIVFNTNSGEKLFLMKENALTERQRRKLGIKPIDDMEWSDRGRKD